MEIKISKLAVEKIYEAVEANNEVPALRIYVTSVGCSGAKFGLAFDDAKDTDTVTQVDGIKFITDTEYIPDYSDGINIDFSDGENEGFLITSLNPVESGCGGGGCGGGCSCH